MRKQYKCVHIAADFATRAEHCRVYEYLEAANLQETHSSPVSDGYITQVNISVMPPCAATHRSYIQMLSLSVQLKYKARMRGRSRNT